MKYRFTAWERVRIFKNVKKDLDGYKPHPHCLKKYPVLPRIFFPGTRLPSDCLLLTSPSILRTSYTQNLFLNFIPLDQFSNISWDSFQFGFDGKREIGKEKFLTCTIVISALTLKVVSFPPQRHLSLKMDTKLKPFTPLHYLS